MNVLPKHLTYYLGQRSASELLFLELYCNSLHQFWELQWLVTNAELVWKGMREGNVLKHPVVNGPIHMILKTEHCRIKVDT